MENGRRGQTLAVYVSAEQRVPSQETINIDGADNGVDGQSPRRSMRKRKTDADQDRSKSESFPPDKKTRGNSRGSVKDDDSGDEDYDPADQNTAAPVIKSRGKRNGKARRESKTSATPAKVQGNTKSKPPTMTAHKIVGTKLRTRKEELKAELKEAEDAAETAVRELKEFKEEMLKQGMKSASAGRDDTVVRSDTDRVFSELVSFAREHAKKGIMADGLSTMELRDVLEAARGKTGLFKCCFISSEGASQIPWVSEGYRLMLEAFLIHFVCANILERPLYFLWDVHAALDKSVHIESVLNQVLKRMMDVKADGARVLRANTIQGFYPNILEEFDVETETVNDPFELEKSHYYEYLCKAFFGGSIKPLFKWTGEEEMAKLSNELKTHFKAVGELTLSLWSQNVEIKCWGCSAGDLQFVFTRNDPWLVAHRMMKLKPGEKSLDEMQLQVVVRPGLSATPFDAQGKAGDTKSWGQAIVFVNPDKTWEERKTKFEDASTKPALEKKRIEEAGAKQIAEKKRVEDQKANTKLLVTDATKADTTPRQPNTAGPWPMNPAIPQVRATARNPAIPQVTPMATPKTKTPPRESMRMERLASPATPPLNPAILHQHAHPSIVLVRDAYPYSDSEFADRTADVSGDNALPPPSGNGSDTSSAERQNRTRRIRPSKAEKLATRAEAAPEANGGATAVSRVGAAAKVVKNKDKNPGQKPTRSERKGEQNAEMSKSHTTYPIPVVPLTSNVEAQQLGRSPQAPVYVD